MRWIRKMWRNLMMAIQADIDEQLEKILGDDSYIHKDREIREIVYELEILTDRLRKLV